MDGGNTMDEGTLVVIEGLDSSGKRTQAEILVERLEDEGEEARYVEFPTHERTRIGRLIKEYLKGDYDVSQEVRALLYSADRYQLKPELGAAMEQGGFVVADRYSQSNYAFQTIGAEDPGDMAEWMQEVDSRLPQPAIVVLIDIPPETARELMEEDGKEQDVHEKDLEFQRKVAERYEALAETHGWVVVEAVEDGELRSKEDIADDIWEQVEQVR